MWLLDHEQLRSRLGGLFKANGLSAVSTLHVVDSMVETSLRGVDSHGINLFPHYVRSVAAGRINRDPLFRFQVTGSATSLMHADHAVGHHAGAAAMDHAVERARDSGLCAVAVADSSHFGAAWYFAVRAARQDMLGFAFTNADALVKAHNAREPFFGTNPICFAAPLPGEEPLCLDMATSLVAWNKVRERQRTGEPLPPDWAFDAQGVATTVANEARSLNPAGGYKGFGLGMMVELLCSLLSGGPAARELLPMFTSPPEAQRRISHFFLALDPARFGDVGTFKQRLKTMVETIRAMQGMDAEVMVPGDPEKRTWSRRRVQGIPVHDAMLEQFLVVDPDMGKARKA
jgi:LDH2 family malate/lactate/ureidoglycolate dehydrogenase